MKILRYLFRPLPSGCAAVSCALLFTACIEVDYDFGGHAPEPQVTINALLTPQEEFTVSLHWSGIYTDEQMRFSPVSEAEIRLFEDGREVVRCTASPQGATNTGFRAATGRRYRLEVDVPDYGLLSAETDVPAAPQADIGFVRQKGGYRHFLLDALTVPRDVKAVWIRGDYIQTEQATGTKRAEISEYYTPSPFVDQVNGANDAYEADEKGSTIVFEKFLRIPCENSEQVLPLRFSVWGSTDEWTRFRHTFRVITPSSAYDRYMRSRYKQQLNSEWGAEENPFIEQITVYSNISNGLGIFAGYNYTQTSEL